MSTRAHVDAERHCRSFCHPIHTGAGEITVRPIHAADAALAQAFIAGLSTTSRYFRFFQALRSLPPGMIERFTRVDHCKHMALIGVAPAGSEQQHIVAEARYALNEDGTSAEIAVAVADRWHRLGVATRLLGMMERIAASTGIARLTGESLAVNEGFIGLARNLSFEIRPDTQDRCFLRVEKRIGLPPAGIGTWRGPSYI